MLWIKLRADGLHSAGDAVNGEGFAEEVGPAKATCIEARHQVLGIAVGVFVGGGDWAGVAPEGEALAAGVGDEQALLEAGEIFPDVVTGFAFDGRATHKAGGVIIRLASDSIVRPTGNGVDADGHGFGAAEIRRVMGTAASPKLPRPAFADDANIE